MKRALLLTLLLLSIAYGTIADYEPMILADLVNKADSIVYGEIQTVQSKTVIIKLISALKGQQTSNTLSIKQFQDWTCAQRFAKYQPKQRIIFFLKKQKGQTHFYSLGAGNEGEVPVFNDVVYYKQQYLSVDKHPTLFKIYGGTINGYSYSLASFTSAIKDYILKKGGTPAHSLADSTTGNPVITRINDELGSHH